MQSQDQRRAHRRPVRGDRAGHPVIFSNWPFVIDPRSGDGHFLGSAHTLAAMQRDHFYPQLADRLPPRTWDELGAKDL